MLSCWITNNNVQSTITFDCTPKSLIFALAAIITGSEFSKYKTIVEKLVKKLLPNIDTETATVAIEQYKKDNIQKAHIASRTHHKLTLDHLNFLYILCILDEDLLGTSFNPIFELDSPLFNILRYYYDAFNISIKTCKKISERVNTDEDSDESILFEVLAAWLIEEKATGSLFYQIITFIPKFAAYPLENDEDAAIIDYSIDNTCSAIKEECNCVKCKYMLGKCALQMYSSQMRGSQMHNPQM